MQRSPFLLTFFITNLQGIAQEWSKINLEKYNTDKKCYCDIGTSEQLLQIKPSLCVCPFANK